MSNLIVTNVDGRNLDPSLIKTWANVTLVGAQTVRHSFNVSSLVDGGTGIAAFNFVAHFSDPYFTSVAAMRHPIDSDTGFHGRHIEHWRNVSSYDAGKLTLFTREESSGVSTDVVDLMMQISGDLA